MDQNESVKYVGDNLHESGKIRFNILEISAKANWALAKIKAIFEDVPLGKYWTQIGLHLRQALCINDVLFNSEIWHGVKPTDNDMFSIVNNQILRYIYCAHAKTQKLFLFLETGCLPPSYIISSRSMIFFTIYSEEGWSWTSKKSQFGPKSKPTEGDYRQLVQEDFQEIHTPPDENMITAMESLITRLILRSLSWKQPSHI